MYVCMYVYFFLFVIVVFLFYYLSLFSFFVSLLGWLSSVGVFFLRHFLLLLLLLLLTFLLLLSSLLLLLLLVVVVVMFSSVKSGQVLKNCVVFLFNIKILFIETCSFLYEICKYGVYFLYLLGVFILSFLSSSFSILLFYNLK